MHSEKPYKNRKFNTNRVQNIKYINLVRRFSKQLTLQTDDGESLNSQIIDTFYRSIYRKFPWVVDLKQII